MLTANDLSKLYSQNLTLIPDLRYSISGLKIQQFHTNGIMHEFSWVYFFELSQSKIWSFRNHKYDRVFPQDQAEIQCI